VTGEPWALSSVKSGAIASGYGASGGWVTAATVVDVGVGVAAAVGVAVTVGVATTAWEEASAGASGWAVGEGTGGVRVIEAVGEAGTYPGADNCPLVNRRPATIANPTASARGVRFVVNSPRPSRNPTPPKN